jgi:ferredoxin-NADP reductase
MSILRHRRNAGSEAATRLLLSARSLDEVLYRDELDKFDDVERFITLTREQPPGWTGYSRRLDREMLAEVAWPAARAFVCGPTAFVEAAAEGLIALRYPAERVKTERFGATG